MSPTHPEPTPALLFDTIAAHQRTAAIHAAIDLDLFTPIAEGKGTVPEIARSCGASERGIRILSDYLVVIGFLTKQGAHYGLTPDSAVFLDRRSPAYMGGIVDFLLSPEMVGAYDDLTRTVRTGKTILSGEGSVETENPIWEKFARAMMPMMAMPARHLAQMVTLETDRRVKVLDVAAGHGLFGIAIAERYPNAEVVALDWPRVLEVAKENATASGVADRYFLKPGSAFEIDFGGGYDLVLLTNFLHHFDPPTCETLLRKVQGALNDGGQAAALEFVPNDDRVSPPMPASFSLTMLATTGSGDAYTFRELESMFRNAGFSRTEIHPAPASVEQVILARK